MRPRVMLYDAYVKKINVWVKRRDAVLKYKAPIIIVLCAIFAIIAGLLATKGMFIGGLECPSEVAYGSGDPMNAKVFLGEAYYEYAERTGDSWSRDIPSGVGTYRVRAVSDRSFGMKSYSEEFAFTVTPVSVSIAAAESQITYGSNPTATGALQYQDKIDAAKFKMSTTRVGSSVVRVVESSIKIVDAKGNDVTSAYEITTPDKTVQIVKRVVTIKLHDAEKEYDGRPLTCNGYDNFDDQLLKGHKGSATLTGAIIMAGSTTNMVADFKVLEGGRNVTSNYDFVTVGGTLTVKPRVIEVLTGTAQKVYDGTDLFSETYFITSGAVLPSHKVEVAEHTNAFDVGVYENELTLKVVDKHNNSADVSSNYEFDYTCGTLTVEKRSITLMPKAITREYDGLPLYTNEATVVTSTLGEGDTVVLNTTSSITEVGTTSNAVVDYTILHGSRDVSANYDVSLRESTLTVIKRAVVVKPLDAEREYDSTALTSSIPEVVAGSLAPGHVMLLETDGSITTVGAKKNNITSCKILFAGADVTESYNVVLRSGTLIVNKRELTLVAASSSKIYDETPLTDDGSSLVSGTLVPGHILVAKVEGSQTDAGEGVNKVASWYISTADYRDVSSNYRVKCETGTLTVEPRPITITSVNATKMYDGTELTASGYSITSGTLVSGHRAIASVIGSQTNAGIGANVMDSIIILDSRGEDDTENYNITAVHGDLTVTQRTLTVKFTGLTETYSGEMIYSTDVVITSAIKPLDGHKVIVAANSKKVGTYTFKDCVGYVMTSDGEIGESSNYLITIESGSPIVIERFSIMIKPEDAEREYDGTPLTSNVAEVVTPSRIPAGHIIELTTSGTVTDVLYNGDEAMPVVNRIQSVVIKNARGEDVTECFSIITQAGTLLVKPRVITLKPKDEIKEFDGTPLKGNTPECSVGSIAKGQTVHMITNGMQIEIGSSENEITDFGILDANLQSVIKNYKITIEKGTLTVTARHLVIAPVNVEKMYDGTPLVAEETEIRDGALLGNHIFSALAEGELTNAGTEPSAVIADSLKITDLNGNDVSHLYEVELVSGTVTVTPRPVTLVFDTMLKIYDGEKFSSSSYTVTSEIQPLKDHSFMIESIDNYAGEYGEGFYTITATDENGEDVTQNYAITQDGVIVIQKRPIFFEVLAAEKEFDGSAFEISGLEPKLSTTLVADHIASVITDSALPGEYSYNAETLRYSIVIINEISDADVTANYEINLVTQEKLTIIQRKLTLSVFDTEKQYDTSSRFSANSFIIDGTLAQGHALVYLDLGSARVGDYSGLRASDLKIVDKDDNDMTSNYQIIIEGADTFSVKITQRTVWINPLDISRVYDGTNFISMVEADMFIDEWTPIIDGHVMRFFGETAELGTQSIDVLSCRIFDKNGVDVTDCYLIVNKAEKDSFELTTVPRPIQIRPSTVSRPYNGQALYGSDKADVIGSMSLLDGHTVSVKTVGSQTEIGSGTLTITEYVIRDAEGNDVTYLYDVNTSTGTVRVLRLSLVLATSDASASYTGNTLSARGVSIFIGELLDGHVIYDAAAKYAEVSTVGTFSNTVEGVRVHDADGNDVTNMYNISYKFGTLTITA